MNDTNGSVTVNDGSPRKPNVSGVDLRNLPEYQLAYHRVLARCDPDAHPPEPSRAYLEGVVAGVVERSRREALRVGTVGRTKVSR